MTQTTTTRRPRKMAREPDPNSAAPVAPKRQTKAGLVEDLLTREGGVTLAELGEATNWLPHTCRAFLTGLRKKGKAVERAKREDGGTVYRLSAAEVVA